MGAANKKAMTQEKGSQSQGHNRDACAWSEGEREGEAASSSSSVFS